MSAAAFIVLFVQIKKLSEKVRRYAPTKGTKEKKERKEKKEKKDKEE